jgi:general L-amino acid transport system substrate-binding protein
VNPTSDPAGIYANIPRTVAACLIATFALGAAPAARAGGTLDAIRNRGAVACGVETNQPGVAMLDSRWQNVGFHADICRAFAAAIFGDAGKVKFVPQSTVTRFTAVQSGEIDVWEGSTALTLSRDATIGLTIPVATFYTGQGFLVNKRINVKTAAELNGATICAGQGTEIERNISDYTSKIGIKMQTIVFEAQATLLSAFYSGRCDAISNDMVTLASNRVAAPNRDDFELLPDLIAKEPHGPVVRSDDVQWATLVRWVVFAMIQAEEFGLTSTNVEQAKTSTDPKIHRFLGTSGSVGAGFAIPNTFAYEIVRQVGNYGEVFDRSLGAEGLKIERGHNKLWSQGRIMMSWLWQ